MDNAPPARQPAVYMASLWLLISLLISLLILPLLEGVHAARLLLLLGLTSIFVVGAMAAKSKLKVLVLCCLVVILPTTWATVFVESRILFVIHCVLGSAFFWYVGGSLVVHVIETHAVTLDCIFGAICAYLLFGLAWALSYWALHAIWPDAFRFSLDDRSAVGEPLVVVKDFSQFVYYSFVTMTTLGYGDITPSKHVTRTLSWMQSTTGQFYVAVVIAWLVSSLPRPGREPESGSSKASAAP